MNFKLLIGHNTATDDTISGTWVFDNVPGMPLSTDALHYIREDAKKNSELVYLVRNFGVITAVSRLLNEPIFAGWAFNAMFYGTVNSREPPVGGVVPTHIGLTVILRYEGVRLLQQHAQQQQIPQQQISQQQIPRQQIQQPQIPQPQIPQTQMIRLPPPHTLQREIGENPSRMHSIRALTRSENGPVRNEGTNSIAAHALGVSRQESHGYLERRDY